jgi:hypothetical protein
MFKYNTKVLYITCQNAWDKGKPGVTSSRAVAQKPNPKISENLGFDE